MTLLERLKNDLRISSSNTDFDDEISDLIDQAVGDLKASGVKTVSLNFTYSTDISSIDANIRRAICLYSKANFGIDNPDKDWFDNQYLYKKAELLNQITQYGNANV